MQRLRAEVAQADLLEDGLQVRDDTGHHGFADVRLGQALVVDEAEDEDAELVRKLFDVGGEAPGSAEFFAVEDAERDVGVAYIKGEKHLARQPFRGGVRSLYSRRNRASNRAFFRRSVRPNN